MIARYRILAQVALLDDYYADGACPDFRFVPSAPTAAALSERRLLWKVVGNRLLVLAQVDETGKPAAGLPPELRLAFYLDLAGSGFLTVTNVDSHALRSRRFHFSNLAANAVGAPAVLNLTRPIDAYDNARAYLPGDFARVGATVHECVRAATGQAPPNAAFWVSKGTVQYASKQDMIPFRTQVAAFTLAAPASAFRIRVFGLDPGTGALDFPLRESVTQATPGEATREAQADLTSLPPGRYRVEINGESFEGWFDDQAVASGAFGVVEIFNHLPPAHANALLDAGGAVKEAAFTVRFGNRRAFWKYATPLRKVDNILVSGDHAQPSPFTAGSNDPGNPAQKDFFVSNRPLPLTEAAAENLFDLIIGSESRPAPKPDPRLPGMLTQTFDIGSQSYTDLFCNIRLNQ